MWSPEKRKVPKVISPVGTLIFCQFCIQKIQDFLKELFYYASIIMIFLLEIQAFEPEANKRLDINRQDKMIISI